MANHDALKVAIVGLRHGHMGTIGPAKPGLIHMYEYLDEFEVVAENVVDEYTLSSIAISDGRLFLRTSKHLYCIGASE